MNDIITQQPVDWECAVKSPDELFADDNFGAQEKLDGIRCVLFCEHGNLRGESRTGRAIKLPAKVRAIMPFGNWIADGELVGDDFTAFDIIALDGEDLRPLEYDARLERLATLGMPTISTVYGIAAKRRLHVEVFANGGEGIIFHRMDSKYRPGKTCTALKLKNWKSDSFRVVSCDGMGVEIATLAGESRGRCAGFAEAGKIIEVRYQEITEAGKLRCPTITGVRDDLE